MTEPDGRDEQRENTDFYYAFCCAFATLLLFATPWFFSFGDFPWRPLGVPVGRILSVLCYAAGVFIAIFVLTLARAGFQKHPELRSYCRLHCGARMPGRDCSELPPSSSSALAFTG